MERREALKTLAVASVAITGASAYEENLIVNKMDMKVQDPKHPTKAELKHLPDIKVGKTDEKGYTLVEVNIGQEGIIHPSTKDHWIYQIELYADGKRVGKVDLEPVVSRGFLACMVKLKGVKTLKAISKCNLHGNYTAKIDL